MTTERTSDRLRSALVVAVVSLLYAGARVLHEPRWPTDFDQFWYAARELLQGGDPYAVVGPGKAFDWPWGLKYPFPAVLLSLPFAALPLVAGRIAFSTATGTVLGFALGRRLRTHWPMLLSASYLIALSRSQWAPALLAVAWLPLAGVAVAAKPNIGLAVLAALRPRHLLIAVASAAVITLVGFLVQPHWVESWRRAIADSPHVAPIWMPGGFLLLLALLRYRRSDARLLLGLAVIPHTPSLYDLLPLFYLCRSRLEVLVLALLTHVLFWGFISTTGGETFDLYAAALGRVSIFVIYLPALVAVLLRPNEEKQSELPDGVDAGVRAWLPLARSEALISALLLMAAAMLIWLPLVTRR